jgi:RimJ/RimL family protein N-acetyltransferase
VKLHLVLWSEDDLDLLRQTNTPEMTAHLGGPEPEEKLPDRHRRYLTLPVGGVFRLELDGAVAGSIGYWETVWNGRPVFETGWAVLPAFQGRGVAAAAALAVVERARAKRSHAFLHAFPDVAHGASNAVCRKAGFTLVGECDVEYPKGHPKRCNDWRVAL